MTSDKIPRRAVLRHGLRLTAAAVALWTLSACAEDNKKMLACANPDSMGAAENALRKARHYVEKSPDLAKTCSGCAFFTAGQDGGACGTCAIFQGPANPAGHCDSWAAKQA
ncbi:MAG TPA: high-potential iron-sulfur protein [Steroidobacteraceae bacterium]